MEKRTTDSKQRILESAACLFSEKGYAATSVRDIADSAQVNVASINYYFSSKERLWVELLVQALDCLNEKFREIDCEKTKDFSDLIDQMYLILKKNHNMIMNIMRIAMSQEAKDIDKHGLDQEILFTPPGSKIIVEYLRRALPTTPKKIDQQWVVQGICATLYHSIKIMCSPFASSHSEHPMFDEKQIRKNLKRSAKLYFDALS
ncbi:MAG: TetR family transcriptional regulator [Bdellovibrionota bacterium]